MKLNPSLLRFKLVTRRQRDWHGSLSGCDTILRLVVPTISVLYLLRRRLLAYRDWQRLGITVTVTMTGTGRPTVTVELTGSLSHGGIVPASLNELIQ